MKKIAKNLVIISGVTGAIGSAIFSYYGKNENNIIYGISRKGVNFRNFLDNNQLLPQKTLICSTNGKIKEICDFIDFRNIDEISYIHCIGLFPFELNKNGDIEINNDNDLDGINDEVKKLSFEYIKDMVEKIQQKWAGQAKIILFSSIANRYKPQVHQSFWKTMKTTETYLKTQTTKNKKLSVQIFEISSVMCPHEVITRPYVFTQTDAKQSYWLNPYDLAKFVSSKKMILGFNVWKIFKKRLDFPKNYYTEKSFKNRKIAELYRK